MKEGCGRQIGMKLPLLTSSATPRWSDSSLETPWREDAEQLRYAPPHWSCTGFFVNHQIEMLPWPARSPDLSPIENMWSIFAQRLTEIAPPAATPDQLWQRVELLGLLYPKNTSKVSLNQCRGVWQR
ncbi:transposable element Tcb1 transposase [Trichonephila clavipes]|nr:transposable element Tcb1 transposase [Trichonephila clavipes]